MIIFNGQPINMNALIEQAMKEKCRECFLKQVADAEDAVFIEETDESQNSQN